MRAVKPSLMYVLFAKSIVRFEAIAQFQPLIEILSKLETNPEVYAAWLSVSFARALPA